MTASDDLIVLTQTYERAVARSATGNPAAARAVCERILSARPSQATALHLLGSASVQSGDPQTGIDFITHSLQLDPTQPVAYTALGNALRALQRPQEALEQYNRALRLDPACVGALNNRGSALLALGRLQEAIESFGRALQFEPDHYGALVNHGRALLLVNEATRALASFEQAVRVRPNNARAFFGCAEALRCLRRAKEALAVVEHVLSIDQGNARAWHEHGCTLQELGRLEEALKSYERAINLDPASLESLCNRGSALAELQRFETAAASFVAALRINPRYPYALGSLLQARMAYCDWTDWQQQVEQIVAAAIRGEPAIYPIALILASDSPAAQFQLAKTYIRMFPQLARDEPRLQQHGRLRIAYMSADFRTHPVSQLLAGVLECHDRQRFEILAVGLQPPDGSALGQRIRSAADRFLDVSRHSDAAAAQLLRELELDVLVDLQGLTQGMRPEILARRPAPVQVSYLGFPGTMGAPYIDYLVADRVVIPEGAERHYSERVVRLPHCFMPFDNRQGVAEVIPARLEAGLPPEGFVFCDFNNHNKITPVMFDVWMRLLHAVPDSCLWLRWASEPVMANLRREAAARGIGAERIIFAPKIASLEDHLGRQRLADLFLDTTPYNAHATAAQALWAGVPVLTCQGASFASRVGASLLHAVGLPQLITHSLEDYERAALELAHDRQQLAQLRQTLAGQRASAPLFDTQRYCRDLESAYLTMTRQPL